MLNLCIAEVRIAEEGGLLRNALGKLVAELEKKLPAAQYSLLVGEADFLEEHVEQLLAALQKKLRAAEYSLFCGRSWIFWKSTCNSCWLS